MICRCHCILVFAAVLLLACSAPYPSSPEPTPDPAAAIRISQGAEVSSMDPYAQSESTSFAVLRNIYDPLTDLDSRNKLVPCLAERWENTSPTAWLFHLRPGVTFHDGSPFDAADAAFSVLRALRHPRSRMQSEIQTVADAVALAPNRLRIDTIAPDPILPLRLAMILMLDREWTEAGLAREGEGFLASRANGTGPYRLELWRKDDRCILAANPNHWTARTGPARLTFLPASNEAARMALLQRGEVDILVNVPTRNVAQLAREGRYDIVEQPGLRLIYLGLDCGREHSPGIPDQPNPLRDVRVRRAIQLALNRPLMVEKIMDGHATPAWQLMPDAVGGHDPSIPEIPVDLEESRRLLADAGHPDGFSVRLDGPNNRYVNDEKILQAVAQQLARVGIRVGVRAQSRERFFAEERNGDCSFFLIGWSNSNGDGLPTFSHLLHTRAPEKNLGNANTSTFYSNPRLDVIVAEASSEFDLARREALLREANAIAMRDLPHIPLHFQNDVYAISKNVSWSPRRDTQVRGVDIQPTP